MPRTNEEVAVGHGERMIEVKLRFWTNDIAETPNLICRKHAWTSGIARINKNVAHGIKGSDPVPFHSLLDVGRAIEKAMIQAGISLHHSRREKKYFADK